MIYHYCRVSTKDQNLDRQIIALSAYKKADAVFCDKQSGKSFERIEYQRLRSLVAEGDEVIVEELDRLGRNKEAVKEELKFFKEKGVKVRMLDVPTTLNDYPGQEWVQDMLNNVLIEVLGAIAEQERIKIQKRQSEGIAAMPVVNGKRVSQKTGRGFGREALDIPDFEKFLKKQKEGLMSITECCKELGISRSTWYKRASAT